MDHCQTNVNQSSEKITAEVLRLYELLTPDKKALILSNALRMVAENKAAGVRV